LAALGGDVSNPSSAQREDPRTQLEADVATVPESSKARAIASAFPAEEVGLDWAGRSGSLELRASVGLNQWDARIEAEVGAIPGGVSLAGGLTLSIPLTDWLQLGITHRLMPSLTMGLGARGSPLQGSVALGFSSAGFSSIEGLIAGAYVDVDGGLRVARGLWLVASAGVDTQRLGLDRSELIPEASAGLIFAVHPRVRLQLGFEARQTFGFGGVFNPHTQLELGSTLEQGSRPWPLLELQVSPRVSLDGYASYRWNPGGTQAVQTYLLGLTWRSP
jgi:hypothetical protein